MPVSASAIYKRSVPSVYLDLINANGTEIQQDLRLRDRALQRHDPVPPARSPNAFEPYIGAGVAILNWRYQESGDWVDPSDATIFRGTFVGNGTATGPMILGGVKCRSGPGHRRGSPMAARQG